MIQHVNFQIQSKKTHDMQVHIGHPLDRLIAQTTMPQANK